MWGGGRHEYRQAGGWVLYLVLCQKIGLVTFMFFFELSFSYVSFAVSFYVSLTNLFLITHSFIYQLHETLKMKEKQDFDSLTTGTV